MEISRTDERPTTHGNKRSLTANRVAPRVILAAFLLLLLFNLMEPWFALWFYNKTRMVLNEPESRQALKLELGAVFAMTEESRDTRSKHIDLAEYPILSTLGGWSIAHAAQVDNAIPAHVVIGAGSSIRRGVGRAVWFFETDPAPGMHKTTTAFGRPYRVAETVFISGEFVSSLLSYWPNEVSPRTPGRSPASPTHDTP